MSTNTVWRWRALSDGGRAEVEALATRMGIERSEVMTRWRHHHLAA